MIQAFISRHGDRIQARGLSLNKTGVNRYSLHVPTKEGDPHVFVETEPYRAATVHRRGLVGIDPYPAVFEIYTFNMLNGYHPGSDLRVRVYYGNEPEVLALKSASGPVVLNDVAKDAVVLAQAYAQDFRWAQIDRTETEVKVTPLITRVPPTPVETDIEVVVIRPFGPLRY